MKLKFLEQFDNTTPTLVVLTSEKKLELSLLPLEAQTYGALIHQAAELADFKGKDQTFFSLFLPDKHIKQLIFMGIGKTKTPNQLQYETWGGALCQYLDQNKIKQATIITPFQDKDTAHFAYGALLNSYRFTKYHTKDEFKTPCKVEALYIVTPDKQAKKHFKELESVAEAIFFTRDIVSEPANIINPETLAKKVKELESLGLKITILGEKDMKKHGMHALLGVGQGSSFESQMVIMEWNGGKKGQKPLAFVGKGVTFDTGGISIKPSPGMEEMKWDMAGSAAVIGTMYALANRNAKVNAVGVVGLVENMPSGTAQRPGDVVTSMSGQTIEVLNTDAEGRLVLADCLWYTQSTFAPQLMVDLATLTGAIIVSLGYEYAGLFSNNDGLAKKLTKAGEDVGEKLWRQPLGEAYNKLINSDIADMQNIGQDRAAGSITAAQFLQRFTNKLPWAHLDIAGTAWAKKATALHPKGATAFGVRLLNAFVKDNYEA